MKIEVNMPKTVTQKYFFVFMFLAVFLFSVFPQNGGSYSNGLPPENRPGESAPVFESTSEMYHVISDRGEDDALALIKELEMRFQFYNRTFHFDLPQLRDLYRVRAFDNEEAYDAYVRTRLGRIQRGAVYLHYTQREKRELVIYRGSPDEKRALPREAFLQFLRGYIDDPPAWIQEGFAVYFSDLYYDDVLERLEYAENLSWLNRVRALGRMSPSPEQILFADILGQPDNFQGAAWSLVSFFMNARPEEYRRILGEVILTLSNSASAGENSEYAARHITTWIDPDTLRRDYESYLATKKTFNELLKSGKDAYLARNYSVAGLYISSALNMRPNHYAPYYYQGLLFYQSGNYERAEEYYTLSLEKGANPALISYAQGINAAAAGKKEEAIASLEKAAVESPEAYRDKANALIRSLKNSPF
jgi:tetratricopeptide (TPR) repeat protein